MKDLGLAYEGVKARKQKETEPLSKWALTEKWDLALAWQAVCFVVLPLIWIFITVFLLIFWAASTTPDQPQRLPQGGSGFSTGQIELIKEMNKGK